MCGVSASRRSSDDPKPAPGDERPVDGGGLMAFGFKLRVGETPAPLFKGARVLRTIATAFAAVLVAACSSNRLPPAPATSATADYQYLIGPLDTVNIIVWRNPELSMVVSVRPDGKISTPLVED